MIDRVWHLYNLFYAKKNPQNISSYLINLRNTLFDQKFQFFSVSELGGGGIDKTAATDIAMYRLNRPRDQVSENGLASYKMQASAVILKI